jgi:flagellar hook-associated protein 3 FlgL
MRISTAQWFQQGLAALTEQQARLSRTQQQIASGSRLLRPADDPGAMARSLRLEQGIAELQRYQTVGDQAEGYLHLEETALSAIGNLLQGAREIALQGNSAALNDTDRQNLAREVQQQLEELLALANRQDSSGVYLFAGHALRTQPFAPDGTGAIAYRGDGGRRLLEIGPGARIPTGDPGNEVFLGIPEGNGYFVTQDDPANTGSGRVLLEEVRHSEDWVPDIYEIHFLTDTTLEVRTGSGTLVVPETPYRDGQAIPFAGIEVALGGAPLAGDRFSVRPSARQDLFTLLDRLTEALQIPGAEAGPQARRANALRGITADLDQGLERIYTVRAGVGVSLAAIDRERQVGETWLLHLQENLSQVRDLDYSEAIGRLQSELTALQAAQQVFVAVERLSLLDFL